jgi:SAM-dependent MidA family methyltransferase
LIMATILPHGMEPSAAALEHSRELTELVAEEIRQHGGWISFEHYMNLALYAPGLGYYSAGATKLGSAGDFVTAPELTPLFGQCLANFAAARLESIPQGVIMELGAGSGALACQIMSHLHQLGQLPREYWILEVSAQLQARQKQAVEQLPEELQARIRWLNQWPQELRGVLLANEVLDALPVHRVCFEQGQWQEMGVALQDGGLVWQLAPLSQERLGAALPELPTHPPRYETEINLNANALIETLADSLREGCAVFVDYGFPAREFYHAQRYQGTLMCHYRHHAHGDPFFYPGLQDITAHVDFTAVARAARAAGLALEDYANQAGWLMSHDFLSLIDSAANPNDLGHVKQLAAVQKLLSPAEMGELFKVLVVGRGKDSTPAAGALGC